MQDTPVSRKPVFAGAGWNHAKKVQTRLAPAVARLRQSLSRYGNPFLYTGRQWDAELGMYHYRTRHMDPLAGRFTTVDSIGRWGDPSNLGNGYTYTGNNPWTNTDPFGLWGIQIGDNGRNIGVGQPSAIFGSDAVLGANQGMAVFYDTLAPGTPYRDAGYYSNSDPGIRGAQIAPLIGAGAGAAAVVLPILVPAVATGTVASGMAAVGTATYGATQAGIAAVGAGAATAAQRVTQFFQRCPRAQQGIATPYGEAVQENIPRAQVALRYVQQGGRLYRQGEFGMQRVADAQFWAMKNPSATTGFSQRMGMPSNGVDWMASGRLAAGQPAITRLAPGIGQNLGGDPEAVTGAGSVVLDWFHMP